MRHLAFRRIHVRPFCFDRKEYKFFTRFFITFTGSDLVETFVYLFLNHVEFHEVSPRIFGLVRNSFVCVGLSLSGIRDTVHQAHKPVVSLQMSDKVSPPPVEESPPLGPTERLLIAAKKAKELGLIQKYGETVKKDGLDGLRKVVWAAFGVSDSFIFPTLGILMVSSLFLHVLGYGYYFDERGGFVIDSLTHIRQANLFELEAARRAVEFSQMI
jgi:hypothetical protein